MMDSWHTVRIGDLCEGIYDGPHATPKKTIDGPIFLGISNLSNGRIDLSNAEHLSEKDYISWTRRIVPQENDVVFSYETRLGEAARIPGGLRCCLGRRMALMRPNLDKVHPTFLHFAYLSPSFQETIRARTVRGSTVDRIALIEFPDFPITIPADLDEQRTIAHMLGSLDDKIELNRRMNATLEESARVLFKSWFVDFDPVRAKMEGREPEGIDAETAALFPDRLVESALGMIPEGWRVDTFGAVVNILDSKRIPLSGREREVRQGSYPYYGATSIMDYIDAYLFDGIYVLMGEDGSVIDTDDHPICQYVWGKFWANNHAHVLQGKCQVSTEHILLFLQQINIKPYINGAVQLKLNQENMKRIPFFVPSDDVCKAFSDSVNQYFGLYRANADSSRTLAATRDALLPKLLSGEVRVDGVGDAIAI